MLLYRPQGFDIKNVSRQTVVALVKVCNIFLCNGTQYAEWGMECRHPAIKGLINIYLSDYSFTVRFFKTMYFSVARSNRMELIYCLSLTAPKTKTWSRPHVQCVCSFGCCMDFLWMPWFHPMLQRWCWWVYCPLQITPWRKLVAGTKEEWMTSEREKGAGIQGEGEWDWWDCSPGNLLDLKGWMGSFVGNKW